MASGHSYGNSNIDGAARVQLGDTYTYNYSRAEAREAIYSNTLAITLGQIIGHGSLQGSFSKVPGSGQMSSRVRERLADRLEILQTYLARVQKIEQRYIRHGNDNAEVLQHLQRALTDRKVTAYIKSTSEMLPKLADLARTQCTNRGGVSCLDEFCDLVERLDKQTNARRNLCGALEHTPVEESLDLVECLQPESRVQLISETYSSVNDSQAVPKDDELEYLYATQDFWRQLAWILQEMLAVRRACWKRLLKYSSPTFFVVVAIVILINTILSEAPPLPRFLASAFGTFFVLWTAYAMVINRRFARRLMKNTGPISLPPV